MREVFLRVLNMSLTASFIILMVLLVRLALRRAPKAFSYALWAVVLLRLLCPLTLSSPVSLVASAQPIPPENIQSPKFQISSGISAIDVPVNDYLGAHYFEGVGLAPTNLKADFFTCASVVWLAGIALLLGYSLISLLLLRRKLAASMPLEGEPGVYLADHIPFPFVLGLFRPAIYLPSGLPGEEREYVLLHERTHIRRFDHITRALAWLALSVHWFNPMVWLAFHLAGKDMEMSCDEAVLRKTGRDVRADYSTSLLRLSTGKRLPVGPLAFGDGDPRSRIENVLGWEKPARRAVVIALIAVVCAGVLLATNRSPLIDPDSATACTSITAASTETPQHTTVYTAQDRRENLLNPSDPRELSQEDGKALLRLINTYRRSVYGWGELELSGGKDQHQLIRISCDDGSYYLFDYWYWNGFSFTRFREDPYVSLVTRYDAQGNPGVTWRMESGFDWAYSAWRNTAATPTRLGLSNLSLAGRLVCAFSGDGASLVFQTESPKGENVQWYPSSMLDGPASAVTFSGFTLSGGWAPTGCAAWTSGDQNAVFMELICRGDTLTTLDYTVALNVPADQAVISRKVHYTNAEEPPQFTNQEILELAQRMAIYLQSGEEYYAAHYTSPASGLSFSIDQDSNGPFVRVTGTIDGVTLRRSIWSPEERQSTYGPLTMEYEFASGGANIEAGWHNDAHTQVWLSTRMSAAVSSYHNAGFWDVVVDLDHGEVMEKATLASTPAQTNGEDEWISYPESITDGEAVRLARLAAQILQEVETFYS